MPRTERVLLRHGTRFSDYIATTAQCCPWRCIAAHGPISPQPRRPLQPEAMRR